MPSRFSQTYGSARGGNNLAILRQLAQLTGDDGSDSSDGWSAGEARANSGSLGWANLAFKEKALAARTGAGGAHANNFSDVNARGWAKIALQQQAMEDRSEHQAGMLDIAEKSLDLKQREGALQIANANLNLTIKETQIDETLKQSQALGGAIKSVRGLDPKDINYPDKLADALAPFTDALAKTPNNASSALEGLLKLKQDQFDANKTFAYKMAEQFGVDPLKHVDQKTGYYNIDSMRDERNQLQTQARGAASEVADANDLAPNKVSVDANGNTVVNFDQPKADRRSQLDILDKEFKNTTGLPVSIASVFTPGTAQFYKDKTDSHWIGADTTARVPATDAKDAQFARLPFATKDGFSSTYDVPVSVLNSPIMQQFKSRYDAIANAPAPGVTPTAPVPAAPADVEKPALDNFKF